MPTERYTYRFYDDPIRLKSVLILLAFSLLGLAVGISEGEISIAYVLSGLVTGIISIVVSYFIRMSYTLDDDKLTAAIKIFSIPIGKESAKYSDIEGIEWDDDPPYRLGHNTIGSLERRYLNLGGGHIQIKKRDSRDITFSARKEELERLKNDLSERTGENIPL